MLKGLTVLQNYPRYRLVPLQKDLLDVAAIMAIMETDSTAQVLHKYPSVLFRFLDRHLMKCHIMPQLK